MTTVDAVPTSEDSRDVGRRARDRAPRRAFGEWHPSRRRRDVLDVLTGQNAIRAADLVPVRWGRMSASP